MELGCAYCWSLRNVGKICQWCCLYALKNPELAGPGAVLPRNYAILPAPWHFYCMPTVDSPSSSLWRVMALILLVLCIGLVGGLVALGIMCKYWLIAKDFIRVRQYQDPSEEGSWCRPLNLFVSLSPLQSSYT